MVHDRALAEDLVQEAFARAFERLSSYDPNRRFAAWFFQILHNVAIDHLRHKRPLTVSLEGLEADGRLSAAGAPAERPDAQAEQAAQARAIEAALARIRPEYRAVIILHYREDLSVQEIAEAMKIPAGSVKTYLHRARKELASILLALGWAGFPAKESETSGRKIP
jgi:RNA polymerase sigma-70 factor (ECF subfamily)